MKKILTISLGLSFVIMSNLYASGDHQGDHMHKGKMTNHSNPNGMTNEQMRKMGHNENNHQGDHMHEGKMTNHSNSNSMTNEQMRKMSHDENGVNHEHN